MSTMRVRLQHWVTPTPELLSEIPALRRALESSSRPNDLRVLEGDESDPVLVGIPERFVIEARIKIYLNSRELPPGRCGNTGRDETRATVHVQSSRQGQEVTITADSVQDVRFAAAQVRSGKFPFGERHEALAFHEAQRRIMHLRRLQFEIVEQAMHENRHQHARAAKSLGISLEDLLLHLQLGKGIR